MLQGIRYRFADRLQEKVVIFFQQVEKAIWNKKGDFTKNHFKKNEQKTEGRIDQKLLYLNFRLHRLQKQPDYTLFMSLGISSDEIINKFFFCTSTLEI
jgi:hypothetical protein